MTTETKTTDFDTVKSHIPGPWGFGAESLDVFHVATGRMIARSPRWGGNSQAAWSTDEPNARLIAAAPDLLAACEALLEMIDKSGSPFIGACAATFAKAAVSKAKGK